MLSAMWIIWSKFMALMTAGGPVMWPLLGMSVVAVALILERTFFFLRTNRPGRVKQVSRMAQLLRAGDHPRAMAAADADTTVYGDTVLLLLGEKASESAAYDAVEAQRQRLERFMPTLSTIITAAPMLGILGTVLGIISSFQLLSTTITASDPRAISAGIAEALITTAAGLVVAIIALFPYNAFRAQIDRTLTRLESLAGASLAGAVISTTDEGKSQRPVAATADDRK